MEKPYEAAEIVLGGVKRALFLSWRAIRRIREVTGIDFLDPSTLRNWSNDHLPAILHELLAHEDDAPSVEEIERKLLHLGNIEEVLVAVFAAANLDLRALANAGHQLEVDGASPLARPAEKQLPTPRTRRKTPRAKKR